MILKGDQYLRKPEWLRKQAKFLGNSNLCLIRRLQKTYKRSFRINTSKEVSQVFILNNLQKGLSPLESALTRNQGVGSK